MIIKDKKRLAFSIVFILMLVILPFIFAAAGDLNSDNKVDASDMSIIIGHIIGTNSNAAADVNGDGKVDIRDAVSEADLFGKQYGTDNTAPTVTYSSLSSNLSANTTSAILFLKTNEWATCKYSTSSGTSYSAMSSFTRTGRISHYVNLTGLSNGNVYNYYVKCNDSSGNLNSTNYHVSFGVNSSGSSNPYPNEPSGLTEFTSQPWNSLASLGWSHLNRESNSSIVTDATAPQSPSNVLQDIYPIGFSGQGVEPAVDWIDLGGVNSAYESYWWKASDPWQGHPSEINKIFFQFDVGHLKEFVTTMRGPPGGPYYIEILPEGMVGNGSGNYMGENVNQTAVTIGQWHHIEQYINLTSGTLKWWYDGYLAGNWTGLTLNADGGLGEAQVAPTWGGLDSGNKTETDYFWYDHVYIST